MEVGYLLIFPPNLVYDDVTTVVIPFVSPSFATYSSIFAFLNSPPLSDHHPTVGYPTSIHHERWRAFITLSGVLSFNTAPFMNFVNVQTIHKMYLSPALFRSSDTIELKSDALGIATAGFDADLLFLLQISHVSITLSMFFRVSVSNFPAFLNAYSICSLLL